MAVAIRLMRFGKKHAPTYRIVALDSRRKRDGSYIEKIGSYNPMVEPTELIINQEKMDYWMKMGARVSDGLRKLMKNKIAPSENTKAEAPAKEVPKAVKATKSAKKTTKAKAA